MPQVEVTLPSFLSAYTKSERKVKLTANDLRGLIDQLVARYGETFRGRILEPDARLKRVLNVYVNGRNARSIGGLDAKLEENDEVNILAAVAGG